MSYRLQPLIHWPEQPALFSDNDVALLVLKLSPSVSRSVLRTQVRFALRQILASLLQCPVAQILLRETRQGPILDGVESTIHLSLSYAHQRCVIGISRARRIGVDIVRIEAVPEIMSLAHLYLSDLSAEKISRASAEQRATCFALAWAQMEARSKCVGMPLTEMTPQRQHALAQCTLLECQTIEGYCIALALLS